jgi:molecular chaperone DnaK
MVQDAEQHKEEDQKRKQAVDARNQADALAHQTEKSMKELGDDAISAEDKAAITTALEALKETLKDENASKEQIDEKVKALTDASHKLAEAMYKKEQPADGAAKEAKKQDEDVIDAEVE